MAYQFGGSLLATQKLSSQINVNKRRLEEDDIEEHIVTKRYFDLNTQFSPNQQEEKNLPAITYASPDYRPLPPTEPPLWLQPITAANSPISTTEDDSEEDDLLTPLYLQQTNTKSNVDYWNSNNNNNNDSMLVDQWQRQ
ncbi:uncharacterized protein BX663DRAFT_515182 [Cokeromyces recurvatus]|uniref:uncharacterized protein n=1 Tax=Cokeromyces recurvatus TaxID=90255 RepID=UPI00221EEDBF|nr:uncharacterized protein BX663DRAFT_515182 [Cokeromyces recurvatus]KAI7901176.1 hypothetical protein BX663DRAFT_515182 [Cokeromyces recurvatus]